MPHSPVKQASPLRQALFPPDGDPALATYAVIDGAACEDLLPKLTEHQPENCCLYAGDLDDDVAEVAPYLIRLEPEAPFTTWLLDNIGQKPWGIFCKAPSTLREMRKHFRKFLIVKGPEGNNLYFRFYDPRVMGIFLATCEAGEIEAVFGPVDSYTVQSDDSGIFGFSQDSGTLKSSLK